MAENSKIEWCDHTFNPWVGCTKVSPACDGCYAESWAKRTGQSHLWTGERRRTTAANWQDPIRWNKRATIMAHAWEEDIRLHGGDEARCIANGFIKPRRPRVFCASLADVFDNQVPERWRWDLWHRIAQTPNLDWLLLTKRPQNIAKMLPTEEIGAPAWGKGWPNVWLGTTAENQAEADRRIPHLLAVPAAIHFLSCEPLLGVVDLTRIAAAPERGNPGRQWTSWDALRGSSKTDHAVFGGGGAAPGKLDWVIAGGESGPGARPMHPDWARSLRDQCAVTGVPFFHKQNGEWCPGDGDTSYGLQFYRMGKKAAGRLLDGVEHNGMPGDA